MTTRAAGPLAGIRWLKQAVNLGHGNPKAIFGAAALIGVASLLPSLATLPLQAAMAPGPRTLAIVMAISIVVGLLMVPLFGGFLRVIDASERGLPAKATDVFAPYGRGETLRFAGYGLAMMVVYFAMFALVVAVAGTGVARWYMDLLGAQGNAQQAALAMQALPDGFGTAVGLGSVLGLFVAGIYAISLGQLALGGRNVPGAMGDGMAGSLKNLLPLLVLAITGLVAFVVFAIGFGLVVGLLSVLAGMVGKWLLLAVVVPLYVGLMLVMVVVMFGVMYHLWRDVCGFEAAPTQESSVAA